jgi:hypothetical protein
MILISICVLILLFSSAGLLFVDNISDSKKESYDWLPFPEKPHSIYEGDSIEVLDEDGNIKTVFWRAEYVSFGRDTKTTFGGWVENKKDKEFVNAKFWRQIT